MVRQGPCWEASLNQEAYHVVAGLRFQVHVDPGTEHLLGVLSPRFCCESSPCVELCDSEASRLGSNASATLNSFLDRS